MPSTPASSRAPPAPDRRRDRRARPVPARQPRRAHHPLRLAPLPLPQRPRPPARPLPVMDPQGRIQDRHPHAQPRAARAVPPPVRQHQAPPRADHRTRDALSRSRRASRRMDRATKTATAITPATAKTPLQITCPRRSPEPPAITAKTPKYGLEITAEVCASLSGLARKFIEGAVHAARAPGWALSWASMRRSRSLRSSRVNFQLNGSAMAL